MSAYVVDKATIDAIVHAAVTAVRTFGPFAYYHGGQRHDVTEATADVLGQMLWNANIASVRYRYPKTTRNLPGPVGLDPSIPYAYPARALLVAPPPDVGFAAKQLSCFNYQACERPDYEQSEAFAFVQALREALLRRLPTWDSAPWGVSEYDGRAVPA